VERGTEGKGRKEQKERGEETTADSDQGDQMK